MKTANVLASALFGALALAAPLERRAYVTETVVVVETQIIYTTVWDQSPSTIAPAATTQPGLFYEHPQSRSHSHGHGHTQETSTAPAPPANTPSPPPPPPSSVYTPAPAPSSVYTPPPPPPAYTPPPAPSSVYTPPPAPAPPQSSSAPSPPSNGGGDSNTLKGHHSNVDITVYDTGDAAGACGTTLHDTDMIVALGYKGMGPSTYNYMTGEATMPACGQAIRIEYNGVTADATIMDKCPGCQGEYDIDLSRAVWKALGISETTRLKANWYTI